MLTFGEADGADVRVDNIVAGDHVAFDVHWEGAVHPARSPSPGATTRSTPPGRSRCWSASATTSTPSIGALEQFGGTERRFELKGSRRGRRVYDDYAHHPTEVAAALAGARSVVGSGRVIAVHQPHLYSRTQQRSAEFAEAYEELADHTIVLEVYGAREDPVPGVSGQLVVDAFADTSRVIHLPDWQEAADEVARVARAGDIVMTLSCGNVYQIIPQVLDGARGHRRIGRARSPRRG